ncbi:hypothetical protein NB04_24480 [Pseudomonas syringae pv. tomato]|nr:hypothetical protein NB04_24480 [Pseudomonas syringae pv. tomato]
MLLLRLLPSLGLMCGRRYQRLTWRKTNPLILFQGEEINLYICDPADISLRMQRSARQSLVEQEPHGPASRWTFFFTHAGMDRCRAARHLVLRLKGAWLLSFYRAVYSAGSASDRAGLTRRL